MNIMDNNPTSNHKSDKKFIYKVGNRFNVKWQHNGKMTSFGCFDSIEEARIFRDSKLTSLYGNIDRVVDSLNMREFVSFGIDEISVNDYLSHRYSNIKSRNVVKSRLKRLILLLKTKESLDSPEDIKSIIVENFCSMNDRRMFFSTLVILAEILSHKNIGDYIAMEKYSGIEYTRFLETRKSQQPLITYSHLVDVINNPGSYQDITLQQYITVVLYSIIPLRGNEIVKINFVSDVDQISSIDTRKCVCISTDETWTLKSSFGKTFHKYGTRKFCLPDLEKHRKVIEYFIETYGRWLYSQYMLPSEVGHALSSVFNIKLETTDLRKVYVSTFSKFMTMLQRSNLAWAMGHSVHTQILNYNVFDYPCVDISLPDFSGFQRENQYEYAWEDWKEYLTNTDDIDERKRLLDTIAPLKRSADPNE